MWLGSLTLELGMKENIHPVQHQGEKDKEIIGGTYLSNNIEARDGRGGKKVPGGNREVARSVDTIEEKQRLGKGCRVIEKKA